jgi:PHD/YefM family antitoxin component YafN of YafNO toxin-antitoxin module
MKLVHVFWVVMLVCFGCRTIVITEAGKYGENGFSGLRNTVNTSLADVRRSDSTVTINDRGEDQGILIALDKYEASEQFMGMVKEVAPELIDLFQTALIAQGAAKVAGSLSDLIGGQEDGDIPTEEAGEILGGD